MLAPGRDLVAVASATDGPKVTLWDYRDPRAPRAAASVGPVRGDAPELTFSADGTVLAVEGGQDEQRKLGLWRVDTPERPQALVNAEADDLTEPQGVVDIRNLEQVQALGGTRVAVVDTDDRLTVYDYADGDLQPVGVTVPFGPGHIAAVLPDGGTAVGDDGTLWDLSDRWIPAHLGVPAVAGAAVAADVRFVGDSRVLAVARLDGAVDLLDLTDGNAPGSARRVVSPQAASARVAAVAALSPRADLVARLDGGSEMVTVTDLHDPSRAVRLPDVFPAPATPASHSDIVYRPAVSLAFTPAGLLAVMTGPTHRSELGSLRLWDLSDLTRPRALGPPVPSDELMSASRDGDLAVRFAGEPGNLQLVDLAAADGPAPLGPQVPFSYKVGIPHAGLAPDGRTLAMPDGVLWDLATPNAPRQLGTVAFGAAVYAFSPDGRTLAAAHGTKYGGLGSTSSELQLWDVAYRDLPRQLTSATPARSGAERSAARLWDENATDSSVVFSADGATVAAHDGGALAAWDLGKLVAVRTDPAPAACAVAVRGLNSSEWARYVGGEAYVDTCGA